MRINFLVNEVAGGWEPTDTRLGGTEESVVKWAEELAKRGHTVTVFRNPRKEDLPMWGDVFYAHRDEYSNKRGMGVTINIKSSEVAPKEPTLYLTNETNASELDLSAYDGVIWPSEWAKANIPVNNDNVYVLPHGYDDKEMYPGKKIPKQCFYASSPDRGLETLLEHWPLVHEVHPDATLIVTYGGEINLPGVINLGEVDEETMNDIYRTSDIWCHPANGGELYCMTGKKAQASGCIPVIIPTMALAETVERGFKVEKPAEYGKVLVEVLDTPMEFRDKIREDIIKNSYTPNWKESTDLLVKIIKRVYNKN